MLATSAGPLEVRIQKVPNKAWKTAEATQRLVHHILSQFKYGGTWLLTMNQQLTKREEFRFKLIERRGHQIVCRTKPGDNGTCWQVTLSPPKGYIVDQIFSDLRMVPPSGEMVKTLPKPFVIDGSKKIEVSAGAKALPPLTIPVKEAITPPIAPIPAIAEIKPEPKTIPSPLIPETSRETNLIGKKGELELDSTVQSIGDSSIALTHGLVAVCMGVSSDGSILRQTAVKLLIQELNLADFVKRHGSYTDEIKAATVLVSALCDKGYFGRYHAPKRKQNRVRETTKGYLLTPHGRAKLEACRPHLSVEVQDRLFKPEQVGMTLADLMLPAEEIAPKDAPKDVPKDVPLSEKYEQMAPLMQRLKERQKSVEDCELLVGELTKQKSLVEKTLSPLEKKLETLQIELAALKTDVEKARLQRDKVTVDLTVAEQLKESEKTELENVRVKLHEIIAS